MQIKEVFSPPEIISVQRLADEIWNEYYPAIITNEQIDYMLGTFQTAKAILQQIQEGYQYFLLKDEAVLGYMAIKRHQGRVFLSKLYIKKACRQKGYAKEAIAFLKDLAGKEGLRSIELTVNRHNTTAITAYDRMGFHNTGTLVQDIGNGFIMDDFTFELLCEKQTIKAR